MRSDIITTERPKKSGIVSTLFSALRLIVAPFAFLARLFSQILEPLRDLFAGAMATPGRLKTMRNIFMESLFTYVGFLAKADGRVSENDIAQAEAMFERFKLRPNARHDAKQQFKAGAQVDFDPMELGGRFREIYKQKVAPARALLYTLVGHSYNGGAMDVQKYDRLVTVSEALGLGRREIERIFKQATASSYGPGQQGLSKRESLSNAYNTLGVTKRASMTEVKAAYKRLIKQHHPDKAIAKGLPEEIINEANDKIAEVAAAYELICMSQGKKA